MQKFTLAAIAFTARVVRLNGHTSQGEDDLWTCLQNGLGARKKIFI
jgi:hypothetical protein